MIYLWNTKEDFRHGLSVTVKKPFVYEPPVGSDKAEYISGLDLSKQTKNYYTTIEEEYIETSRYILYLDKGITIPVNAIEIINYIMDMIEEETGYGFYDKWQGKYNFGIDAELDQYFQKAYKFKR